MMSNGRSCNSLFPGNPHGCSFILMKDSCGCVCQSISVLPFPMDFSSSPFYGFSEVHVYHCGQTEFMCVSSPDDFPPGSWAESPWAVNGNGRRRESIPGMGRGPVAADSSLCSLGLTVKRSCDMSDCGFVKSLPCLAAAVVLSWNKPRFVCPLQCAMTEIPVCCSLETGNHGSRVWDGTAW